MKILCLTSRFPFPPIGGDKLRFFNILKYLSKKHEVSILCFSDRKIPPNLISSYQNYFCAIDVVIFPPIYSYINCIIGSLKGEPLQISYYRSKKMEALVKEKIGQKEFDMIFVHLIRMAEYVKEYPICKILDFTDAQSLNYIRAMAYTRGKWSIIHRLERKRVHQYEQYIWRYFDKTLVVSPVDQQYLLSFNDKINVEVLPNGVDIGKYSFKLNDHRNHQICFIGNMRTFPNTDAVVWFSYEVLPLIKKEIPDTKFYIVGAEPSNQIHKLAKLKDVYITGEVENINEYVWNSAVSVAPMRVGAGIQNKILESMALGTPVVTTSIGLEGIDVIQERHIFVSDTPEDFSRSVIRLIKDKDLRMQISREARKLIEENYTWDKALEKLDLLLSELIHRARSGQEKV